MLLPYDASRLRTRTAELDAWKDRLDYRGPFPRMWAGRLRRELEAEAIAASTAMEGVQVTVDEVRRILAGQAPADVRHEDRALVEGYREAMRFVLRRADDSAFAWGRELIVGLHDRVLAGSHAQDAGRLRTERSAFVVNRLTGEHVFLPPPGADVPSLVDELCSRMEQGHDHPALGAAWVHIAVAAVHPFRDGNGRTARVCASLAMYRGGFKRPEFTSLEEWWGRHLPDYYASFASLGRRFDPSADVTMFIAAHLDAHLHQVRVIDTRERVERQIWQALEEIAHDRGIDPRVANALWDAFFERPVTAGYYRSIADVSAATATKDLSTLVAAGMLAAQGVRRGRRYLPAEALYEAVGRIVLVDVAGPPEGARAAIVTELGRRVTDGSSRT
jgi:Fic family protein